jgi:NAD(P)-dependent dehydrogenase (short-subunit alcohol dehydrogenase family)
MDLGLKGKVAMVAGASRGLGHAVALVLAREGARVSLASRDDNAIRDAARRIAEETKAEILPVAVDVRSADSIAAWHSRTMEQFGGVDLLFTNAGGPPAGTALSFDDATWQSAFELLVLSAVRMVRVAVPSMQARGGGAIVVSTSSAVKEPVPWPCPARHSNSGGSACHCIPCVPQNRRTRASQSSPVCRAPGASNQNRCCRTTATSACTPSPTALLPAPFRPDPPIPPAPSSRRGPAPG